MKQHFVRQLFIVFILFLCTGLFAQFAGGNGTSGNPYQISTPEQLNLVRNYLTSYFIMTNDISLYGYLWTGAPGYNSGAFWQPIGDDANRFRGNFNGNGFNIGFLKINRPTTANVGLFGYLGYGATVQNVKLVSAVVTGGNATGALVGANRSGNIYNCGSLNGTVNGGAGWAIGGLVGFSGPEGRNFSFIKWSFSTGTVSGSNLGIGGLVGQNGELGALDAQVVENCYSSATVNGGTTGNQVGGLIGSLATAGWVINSYSTGKPTGATNVGGFIGAMASSLNLSNNNFWDTETSGTTFSGADGVYMAGTNSLPPQGRTSSQMKIQSTYSGWDFTTPVWHIETAYNNGYPHLAWQAIFSPNAPLAVSASAVTTTGFTAVWNATSNTDGYFLDISSNSTFSSFVTGYNNFDCGTALNQTVTSLAPGTTYFYRVRAANVFGTSYNSNTVSVQTACYSEGTGTASNPYRIYTATELNLMRNFLGDAFTGKCFKLMNDIDLTSFLSSGGTGYNNGSFWLPVGNNTAKFRGQLDGNYHKIIGIKAERANENYIGLFGYLGSNAVVKNIGVVIDPAGRMSGNYFVSGISGQSDNESSISQSYVIGVISGMSTVGSIVGQNGSLITNCYANCSVSGSYCGGLAGSNQGHISYSYFTGLVSGTNTGGLVALSSLGAWTSSSYWNRTTSGQTTSAGENPSFGKTTAELQTQSTYAGWDFLLIPIWHIASGYNNGFPHLAWEPYATSAPVANAAVNVRPTSFTASWSSIHDATVYFLDVATDSSFTSFVSGYNNASIGTATIINITGLTSNVTYYYRVRASNIAGTSGNSNPITVFTPDLAGAGTELDPYQITNAIELNKIRNYLGESFAGKCFKLINDIDLTSYLTSTGAGYDAGSFWLPIGDNVNQFRGTFDGNNHKITFLKVNRATTLYVGLFGFAGNGSLIKNLGVDIDPASYVKGGSVVGGITGFAEGSAINNCYVTGTVTGIFYVGGLIGINAGSTGNDCFVNGSVIGEDYLGGLVGVSSSFSTYTRSYTNCSVTGTGSTIGGLIGHAEGSIINKCYSIGTVTGVSYLGGLTGRLYGSSISNCYTKNSVNGHDLVGGISGFNQGNINYSYASGAVSGISDVGGIAGASDSSIVNCFWDRSTTGQLHSANSNDSFGKTTAEMKSRATYITAGWDFLGETANGTNDIWAMSSEYNNGYPNLDGINLIQTLNIPQNIQSVVVGNEVQLSWNAVAGANSYKVFGADSPNGTYTEIASGIAATSWVQTINTSKKFYYVVASTDASN